MTAAKTPKKEDKCLTREEILRIELCQERIKNVAMMSGQKQLEGKVDELQAHIENLNATIKVLEQQLRQTKRGEEIFKLQKIQADQVRTFEDVKKEVGRKHGIEDWSKVTYNDDTGMIFFVS